MSMTSESIADNANTIKAICTSTSASRDGGQRSLLPRDGFDDAEILRILIGREARLGVPRAFGTRTRERADGTQVRRPAVDWIVGAARPRNRRELRVNGHRLRQERDLVGIDRDDRLLDRPHARGAAFGERALIDGYAAGGHRLDDHGALEDHPHRRLLVPVGQPCLERHLLAVHTAEVERLAAALTGVYRHGGQEIETVARMQPVEAV